MNTFKTATSLTALVALMALAGCDQRNDSAAPSPGAGGTAGGTASAPGMSGDTGSMSPGGTATTPPAGSASGPDTMTKPPAK